ncbi:MAG: helix-turn-helix domain-containing protein [Eubacterium sp.]|nr:helix-turn-helix domain-containing protein [Eubacterium sp.]
MQKRSTYKYQRIRDLREDKGYLQQDIANVLDLYLNTYRRYETGQTTIPVNLLRKLSEFYNVSMDYLTEIEEEIKHS